MAYRAFYHIFNTIKLFGKEEFIVKNLKKLLAIVVCIAMMVPTVAFAATSSPAKVDVKSATAKSLTYNAKSQTTTIVVNGKTLTLNKDFKVVSGSLKATKAGTYTVKIKGIGNYSGDTTVKYTVNAQQSYKATAATKTYNAKNQTTKVTVKYGNTVLKRGTDYKITGVTKAKNAGKYKITVKGINNYKGTKTIYYTINKAAQKSVKVSVNASKKKVTVSGVKAKAKVTYKSGNKKVTVKNGKITVGKGVKKGTKVRITVKVAATKNYKAYSKSIIYKVK